MSTLCFRLVLAPTSVPPPAQTVPWRRWCGRLACRRSGAPCRRPRRCLPASKPHQLRRVSAGLAVHGWQRRWLENPLAAGHSCQVVVADGIPSAAWLAQAQRVRSHRIVCVTTTRCNPTAVQGSANCADPRSPPSRIGVTMCVAMSGWVVAPAADCFCPRQCRKCGLLLCGACTTKRFPLFGHDDRLAPQRSCDGCFNRMCTDHTAPPSSKPVFEKMPARSAEGECCSTTCRCLLPHCAPACV